MSLQGVQIWAFVTPLLSSNMYLLSENRRGIIIDPYDGFTSEISGECDTVDCILLTHEHYDHISGANALRERYGCPVVCSEVCGERIQNSTHNFSRYYEAYAAVQTGEPISENLPPVEEYFTHADETFSGQRTIAWQNHELVLTETPGHSPGSVCILVDGEVLFAGDTLLHDGVAVTRFPGGSRRQYEQVAVPYLRGLPEETMVYPGHYGPFKLKEHKIIKMEEKTHD